MTEEVSIASKTVNCEICGLMTAFRRVGGVIMCLACKRFYLRNRNKAKSSLICLSAKNGSTENCCVEQQSTSKNSSVLRRKICPACRLERCVSLRTSRNNKQSSPSPSSSSSTTIALMNNGDLQIVEETLRNLVEGTKQLFDRQNALELRNNDYNFADYFQILQNVAPHINALSVNLKNFVQFLPGYKDIALQDRCHLFTNCVSVNVAENTYHHPEPFDLSMNRVNFTGIVNCFPKIAYFGLESRFMKSVLDEWQPTQVEFAFLLAFLYTNAGAGVDCKAAISKMRRQLEAAYQAYSLRQFGCSGDGAVSNKRRDYQSRAISLFSSSSARRYQSFAAIMERCSLLRSLNPLFAELISKRINQNKNN